MFRGSGFRAFGFRVPGFVAALDAKLAKFASWAHRPGAVNMVGFGAYGF